MYSILHLDLWVAHKSWICCLSMGMYVPIAGSRTLAKCEWFDSPCFDIGSNQLYRAQLSEWGHTIGQRFAWRVYKCIFYALAAFELFSAHWSTIVVRNNFEFVLFFFFAPFVFGTKLHTHTYEAIGISSHQLAFEYFGMESKFISMEFFDISIVLLLIGGCASQSIPFVVGLFHRTSSATVIGESLPHKLCMIITFVLHTTRLVWKLGIISIEPQRRLLSHLHTTHPFTPRYHRFKQSICAPPSTTRTESKALVQLYKQPISTTGDLSETRPDWKCDEHLLTDILQSTHAHSVLDDGVLSSFWFSPVSERANERTNKREPLRLKVFSAVRLDRRNGFSICL